MEGKHLKATGIVRRIDDLGRVVVPKEIRRTLRIREGDPLEIFTDKDGEFVFGPLCPHKSYAIELWANKVEHVKICKVCNKDKNCLKGIDLCCDKDYKKDDYNTEETLKKKKKNPVLKKNGISYFILALLLYLQQELFHIQYHFLPYLMVPNDIHY